MAIIISVIQVVYYKHSVTHTHTHKFKGQELVKGASTPPERLKKALMVFRKLLLKISKFVVLVILTFGFLFLTVSQVNLAFHRVKAS